MKARIAALEKRLAAQDARLTEVEHDISQLAGWCAPLLMSGLVDTYTPVSLGQVAYERILALIKKHRGNEDYLIAYAIFCAYKTPEKIRVIANCCDIHILAQHSHFLYTTLNRLYDDVGGIESARAFFRMIERGLNIDEVRHNGETLRERLESHVVPNSTGTSKKLRATITWFEVQQVLLGIFPLCIADIMLGYAGLAHLLGE